MKVSIVLFGLVMMTACVDTTKKTPNGFEFKIIKEGDGVLAKAGEVMVFNYQMKDSKDSLWFNTDEEGMPAALPIGDTTSLSSEPGMIQVFRMLSKGDSVTFTMPIPEFFTKVAGGFVPPNVDTTRTLSFSVGVIDIMDMEGYQIFQTELMEKKSVAQLEKDGATIDSFLKDKGVESQKTAAGVRYVITQPGEGENVTSGQTVSINYTGTLLDGTFFDSNIKTVAEANGTYNPAREPYAPYDVTVDQSSVITGWHDAIKALNKGAKATVYIPSPLAYGPQRRSEEILENSILVFELEIVDVK